MFILQYALLFVSFQNIVVPCMVKMESETFEQNCEISDEEDELDLVLHRVNLREILVDNIGNNPRTDSDNNSSEEKTKN